MTRWASGKKSRAQCDRCGFVVKYLTLANQVIAGKLQNIYVCEECLDEDNPQWQVRFLRMDEAIALHHPRPFQGEFITPPFPVMDFNINAPYPQQEDIPEHDVGVPPPTPTPTPTPTPGPTPTPTYWDQFDYSWTNGVPPLFVTAYGGISGKESLLAQFPLIVADQGSTARYTVNYPAIRAANPDVKLLAYLMVMDEILPGTPGPGNAVLIAANDPSSYCYVNGVPVTYNNGAHVVRVRDCRSPIWQTAIVEAALAIMGAYPFDGIYLDNCTIFTICNPDATIRAQMRDGLAAATIAIRAAIGSKLIMGNGASLDAASQGALLLGGLNGSLTENRFAAVPSEGALRGYTAPIYNLAQSIVSPENSITTNLITQQATVAFNAQMFYAVQSDYSHFVFPQAFQDITDAYYRQFPQ